MMGNVRCMMGNEDVKWMMDNGGNVFYLRRCIVKFWK